MKTANNEPDYDTLRARDQMKRLPAPEPPSPPILGMRQQIRAAKTTGEVALLLSLALRFEHASDSTKAAWHRAAERRRKELGDA